MKSGLAAVTGTGRVDVPYELVPSTGERRKDTSLRYILHLALGSGRQPSPHFPFSPSAMHLLLGSTFATIQSSLCVTQRPDDSKCVSMYVFDDDVPQMTEQRLSKRLTGRSHQCFLLNTDDMMVISLQSPDHIRCGPTTQPSSGWRLSSSSLAPKQSHNISAQGVWVGGAGGVVLVQRSALECRAAVGLSFVTMKRAYRDVRHIASLHINAVNVALETHQNHDSPYGVLIAEHEPEDKPTVIVHSLPQSHGTLDAAVLYGLLGIHVDRIRKLIPYLPRVPGALRPERRSS
ncbi:hypothetical protein F2P81_011489 [Scophthalmus maximus]|uniref:Uncharacterized protein n=1 Tax=Scophthalmus maximus TaxID=52904 RepID=A0A6A4SRY2_SCOMX|nr:hypothetical protein F2P81_011489 [Scophthalmus maximus]